MRNLIVEIGNTALKATWSDGITLGKTFRYQGEKVLEYILSLLDNEKPDVVVISSAGDIPSKWESVLSTQCSKLVLMDSRHSSVSTAYSLPSWLSPDRVASVIASRFIFNGKPVVIFDFGTTLTIDFLESSGGYKGGVISPGCRTRFKSVNRYSKALPLLDTPDNPVEMGDSISTSIEAGVISGIMFEIKGHLENNPDSIVVFTGGDAIYFAKRLKNSIFVICNLVLIGLALIAKNFYESNL